MKRVSDPSGYPENCIPPRMVASLNQTENLKQKHQKYLYLLKSGKITKQHGQLRNNSSGKGMCRLFRPQMNVFVYIHIFGTPPGVKPSLRETKKNAPPIRVRRRLELRGGQRVRARALRVAGGGGVSQALLPPLPHDVAREVASALGSRGGQRVEVSRPKEWIGQEKSPNFSRWSCGPNCFGWVREFK